MSTEPNKISVIVTGATGMVGEGVLLECLENPAIKRVLSISRKPCGVTHPRLTEMIVPDFFELDRSASELAGYDACFYCAGISSRGMKEPEYSRITYDTTLHFANVLVSLRPQMVLTYVSGQMTDSSEKGRTMWARVKGRTENALMRVGFRSVYNLRPGLMNPTAGQKNVKGYYKMIGGLYPLIHALFPRQICTIREIALAMIHSVLEGYPKQVLEVEDIRLLAKG